MNRLVVTALAVSGFITAAGAAQAAPVSLGTISADGLLFTISREAGGSDLKGDGTSDNYLFTLTLDTSGYTGSDNDWISWVSPNVAKHDAASQTSAPSGWQFHDGAANNASGCNDVSASGKICSQPLSTDQSTKLDGTTYTWIFNVDTTGADPFIDPPHLQAAWFGLNDKGKVKKINAISVDFERGTGTTDTGTTDTGTTDTGTTADTGTTDTGTTDTGTTDTGTTDTGTEGSTGATDTGNEVPEPASMLLLGSGLAGAALKLRRNRK